MRHLLYMRVPPLVRLRFFAGVFLSYRMTGACAVTTDLITRVNVRTTKTTTTTIVRLKCCTMLTNGLPKLKTTSAMFCDCFSGKMRSTCCLCLGETHLHPPARDILNNEQPRRLDKAFGRLAPLLSSPGKMCVCCLVLVDECTSQQ